MNFHGRKKVKSLPSLQITLRQEDTCFLWLHFGVQLICNSFFFSTVLCKILLMMPHTNISHMLALCSYPYKNIFIVTNRQTITICKCQTIPNSQTNFMQFCSGLWLMFLKIVFIYSMSEQMHWIDCTFIQKKKLFRKIKYILNEFVHVIFFFESVCQQRQHLPKTKQAQKHYREIKTIRRAGPTKRQFVSTFK